MYNFAVFCAIFEHFVHKVVWSHHIGVVDKFTNLEVVSIAYAMHQVGMLLKLLEIHQGYEPKYLGRFLRQCIKL